MKQQLTSPQPVDGVSPVGSAVNNNRYSRLHLAAANPDWMPSLTQSQPRSVANRTGSGYTSAATHMGPPAPVGSPEAVTTTSVAAPAPSSRGVGFLSMFYRGAGLADTSSPTMPVEAARHTAPQPPVAIGGTSTPPAPSVAVPVNVSMSVDTAATGRPQTAEVRMVSPVRREGVRAPLALGSDTWNALGTATLPRARAVKLGGVDRVYHSHPVAPPSIDAAPVTAGASMGPRPLWSDLPAAHESRNLGGSHAATTGPVPLGAPTLDAFRPLKRVPEPPKPISTSPIRESDTTPASAPSPAHVHARPLVPGEHETRRLNAQAQALRPVGEGDAPLTQPPVRRMSEPVRGGFFRGAQVRATPTTTARAGTAAHPFAGLSFLARNGADNDSNSDDEGPVLPSDLTALDKEIHKQELSMAQAPPPQRQSATLRAETQRGTNAQHFLSTLFSSVTSPTAKEEHERLASPVDPSASVSKSATARLADALMSFNALELAIGSGSSNRKGDKRTAAATVSTPPPSQQQQQQQASNVDYANLFSTAFDEFDDDSEESMDHLKQVVSIVLQTAKQPQPSHDEDGSSTVRAKTSGSGSGNGSGGSGSSSGGGGGNSRFTLYSGSSSVARDVSMSSEWKSWQGNSMFQAM